MGQLGINKPTKTFFYIIFLFLNVTIYLLLGCSYKPSIHYLASKGENNELKKLLSSKPQDANLILTSGLTPLHMVAFLGRLETAKLLISNGANIDMKDTKRETPLHKAALGGHPEMVRFLLKNGAAINSKNSAGQTPLERAFQCKLEDGMGLSQVNECLSIDLRPPSTLMTHGSAPKALAYSRSGGTHYVFLGPKDWVQDYEGTVKRDGCAYDSNFDLVAWMKEGEYAREYGQFRFNKIVLPPNREKCGLVSWPDGMSHERKEAMAKVLRIFGDE